MLPHLAPRRSKCSAVVYADRAALERLPNLMVPAAARRRALAVMLHEHHREPANLDAPAPCAGTTSLSGQPIAAQLPPGNCPGLSAPERKARSQKQVVCPRKLREPSCLSLRASRVAAACCLRRSCRRDRGPVTLPRSGCPIRRSQHPAALPNPSSLHSPRQFSVTSSRYAPVHAREPACHNSTEERQVRVLIHLPCHS